MREKFVDAKKKTISTFQLKHPLENERSQKMKVYKKNWDDFGLD